MATQNRAADLSHSTVIDLSDLTAHPERYNFFNFRPGLRKLVLSGREDSTHSSILWYTGTDGAVGLHYHT